MEVKIMKGGIPMSLTFRGGIHIEEYKNTKTFQIEEMPEPTTVAIPMSQHIGTPCIPLVKTGDKVNKGQKIGDNTTGLSCPVHASISGKIKSVETRINALGKKGEYVVIENDFLSTLDESVKPIEKKINELTREELIAIIREAGISGMGGAGFPTFAKISSAIGKAKTLIINIAECEPYITANHRLVLEQTSRIINGAKILMKACGVAKGYIAIEDNKKDAIKLLKEKLENSTLFKLKILKTKYPQGDERQLIYAIDRAELGIGKLPADVGFVVFNAETCANVYKAMAYGMPLISRVVTVDGDCIKNPKNLSIPIGTSIANVIECCGGFIKEPEKIINGGPMMGISQWDINAPIIKSTSAILALSESFSKKSSPSCIRCGRCTHYCPMHLMPGQIATFDQHGDYDLCEKYGAINCVECGICTYICPGNEPIVQYIRHAKDMIKARKK